MTSHVSPKNDVQTTGDAGDAHLHTQSPSATTDNILMADVTQTRLAARGSQGSPGKACEIAMQQYLDTSPDIFKVRSGQFAGMKVPESVRCAIFQSNVAEKAGLINKSEITVRALEFGAMMHRKGYSEERFQPGKSYPDGTYIVGNGAHDGTNSRHVAMVCGGRLIHTRDGKVVNEPIGAKFWNGAYDSIKVYTPPRGARTAELDPEIMSA